MNANTLNTTPSRETQLPAGLPDGLPAGLADALARADNVDLDAAYARLTTRADDEGMLDVAYHTVDSPYGRLLLAATTNGLVRVAFEREGLDAVLEQLSATISPRILRSGRRTGSAARQLDEYFAGNRRQFDVAIDLRLVHGFRRTVVAYLDKIGYGSTRSYRDVAHAVGNPSAMRAVGSACSHNPLPVVIPCHRVVRTDGTIGNYLGGTEMKVALLAMEAP